MESSVEYRLQIAQGFLNESRQDVALDRWRSAVDNAQLAVRTSSVQNLMMKSTLEDPLSGTSILTISGRTSRAS